MRGNKSLEWFCVLAVLVGTGLAAPKMLPQEPKPHVSDFWHVVCWFYPSGWFCPEYGPQPKPKPLQPDAPSPCPAPTPVPTCDPTLQSCP